jgi:hypothetical protein
LKFFKLFCEDGVYIRIGLSNPSMPNADDVTKIGPFFLVYIHSRLSEHVSESQAGFGTTFKGTDGYQKSGTSFLKRVGRNFTISK